MSFLNQSKNLTLSDGISHKSKRKFVLNKETKNKKDDSLKEIIKDKKEKIAQIHSAFQRKHNTILENAFESRNSHNTASTIGSSNYMKTIDTEKKFKEIFGDNTSNIISVIHDMSEKKRAKYREIFGSMNLNDEKPKILRSKKPVQPIKVFDVKNNFQNSIDEFPIDEVLFANKIKSNTFKVKYKAEADVLPTNYLDSIEEGPNNNFEVLSRKTGFSFIGDIEKGKEGKKKKRNIIHNKIKSTPNICRTMNENDQVTSIQNPAHFLHFKTLNIENDISEGPHVELEGEKEEELLIVSICGFCHLKI